jgi:hypothetical protein
LNGANLWYQASDPLGPWSEGVTPPAAVRDVVPPDTSTADRVHGPPPHVLVATEPTELIAIDGQPNYAPLVDDDLLYITNTESDVVREVNTQDLYVLIAGRWYRSRSTEGPWIYLRGDQLPGLFRRIPPNSPKSHLLASVAGTDLADDAVADAEIPQTSAIRRGFVDIQVIYDGPPHFEPIPGTDLQYAVNTDAEVILADGRYYACDQGVWLVSDGPEGPWSVSDTRPIGINEIPPSCPVYDVRYVYVYDANPEVVYVGYLPGYLGCYPYYGTVIYGTGHRYRPWRHRHYYSWPSTWGFAAHYDPWRGRWGFGSSYGISFLRVGYRWGRDPRASYHFPAQRWFGPGGYRRPLMPRERTLARGRLATAGIGDRTPSNLYRRPRNAERFAPPGGPSPLRAARPLPRAVPRPNDVFAGKDGKVYQRDTGGHWRVNEGRVWKPARVVDTPRPVIPPLPGDQHRAGGFGSPAPGSPVSGIPVYRPHPRPAPATPGDPGAVLRPASRESAPPPRIRPTPGNLEREFRGRERAKEQRVTPPAAQPGQAPANKDGKPAG